MILSNQIVVACVQASVKARRPPYRAHGNFNASPRLSDGYHGAGRSAHKVTRSYPDHHCLSFVGIQVWRRDFHRRCECFVSGPRGSKTWPLMTQVVRLARFETGFVLKKWSESRIAGVVRSGLILKHYVNGKTLGLDKSGPRREVIRLLRWSGTEVILYREDTSTLTHSFNLSDPYMQMSYIWAKIIVKRGPSLCTVWSNGYEQPSTSMFRAATGSNQPSSSTSWKFTYSLK